MANINSLRVDPELELNGIWVKWVFDIEFLIARMGNTRYDEEVRRISTEKANSDNATIKDFSDDELQEIAKEAASKFIILNWSNLNDDNDEPIEYSPEKALEFLNDDTLRDMYKFIILNANSIENYRRAKIEASAKNLETSSDGNQNGDNSNDS